jgi:hypothetical protein
MIHLDLSDEEARLLRELLESDLSELRTEIAGTDTHDFRERLKQKEAALASLRARLG